jgi:predicted lipoprotein with Yx(FWY)xxD motif
VRIRGRTIAGAAFTISMFGSAVLITPAWAATVPSATAVLNTAPGNAQARLHWAASADNGSPITGYVVTPFVGATAKTPQTFKSIALTQVVTGLTDGTKYTFEVAAKNKVGTGPPSSMSSTVIPTAQPALKIAANATMGQPILVNSYGFAVYLFVPDGASPTSTEGPYLQAIWPFVTWSGPVTVGSGLVATSAAAHLQPDLSRLIGYHSHLLYTFVSDHAPGEVTGQGSGGEYFVLNAEGNVITHLVPTFTGFSPASGTVGTTVTITGMNLAKATKVSFNGTAAVIVSDTATKIIAMVPVGATTGKISVTTTGGTMGASARVFTVT